MRWSPEMALLDASMFSLSLMCGDTGGGGRGQADDMQWMQVELMGGGSGYSDKGQGLICLYIRACLLSYGSQLKAIIFPLNHRFKIISTKNQRSFRM